MAKPEMLSVRIDPEILSELRGLVLSRCYLGHTTSVTQEVAEAIHFHIAKHKSLGVEVLPRGPGSVRVGPPLGNQNSTKKDSNDKPGS